MIEMTFSGFISIDSEGAVCFCTCSHGEKEPSCRKQYNCSEAVIIVQSLPLSRPSDEIVIPVRQASRKIRNTTKELDHSTEMIKKNVINLNKSFKRIRFKK